MDPTLPTVIAVLKAAKKIYDLLKKREKEAEGRLFEARKDEGFNWAAELAQRDGENLGELERLGGRFDDTEEKLRALIDDPQLFRVRQNYGYEAAREAIDERRLMLAYAAAGSVSPNLSIAQIARVERTVRELDGADILLLRDLENIVDPAKPEAPRPDRQIIDARPQWTQEVRRLAIERFALWDRFQPSGHILFAAGCVVLITLNPEGYGVTGPGINVTHLGRWVLEVMHGYLRSREPLEPTPARRS